LTSPDLSATRITAAANRRNVASNAPASTMSLPALQTRVRMAGRSALDGRAVGGFHSRSSGNSTTVARRAGRSTCLQCRARLQPCAARRNAKGLRDNSRVSDAGASRQKTSPGRASAAAFAGSRARRAPPPSPAGTSARIRGSSSRKSGGESGTATTSSFSSGSLEQVE
jgi:hypothetical protein